MSPFDDLQAALRYHIVNTLGWTDLHQTQRDAIQPVLSGEDVLLLAPTAGGKTEAAMFPLLSRMASEGWHGLSVLYVCPLKALLNNLEPRLRRYASFAGFRVGLWHGDVGSAARRGMLRDSPEILLTTPESLEAILISTKVDHGSLFGGVRALVIDELHAFAGDDRGGICASSSPGLSGSPATAFNASGYPRLWETLKRCFRGLHRGEAVASSGRLDRLPTAMSRRIMSGRSLTRSPCCRAFTAESGD